MRSSLTENELLLLLAIHATPSCGYQLMRSPLMTLQEASPARSTIYSTLQRLTRIGYLKPKNFQAKKTPERTVYYLTPKGLLYLIRDGEYFLACRTKEYQASIRSLVEKKYVLQIMQDHLKKHPPFGNQYRAQF